MVDDGSGNAVGYILGVPDSVAFVQRWRSKFIPILAQNGIAEPAPSEDRRDQAVSVRHDVYNPEEMLHFEHPDLVKQYPAHLHIDILLGYQRQGWGPRLMAALFQKLLSEGAAGIFLGMAYDNEGAGRFYQRMGFQKYAGMNDKGEVGRDGNGIYWVRSFQRDHPV